MHDKLQFASPKDIILTSCLNFMQTVLYAVANFCGNVELCRLTEQVVFSDPYKVSQYNRWTSPFLDREAEAVREDNILKLEVAQLKSLYYFYIIA